MAPKDLERLLHRLDGRGYKAYRELLGEHDVGDCRLHVDHVQADPFAAPSRLRVRMPLAEAALPEHVFADAHRQRAARDWLARRFRAEVRQTPALAIEAGAQTVLDRTAVLLGDGCVELRFTAALPARGRSILGRAATTLLRDLHRAARAAPASPRSWPCSTACAPRAFCLHPVGINRKRWELTAKAQRTPRRTGTQG